jgi:hypothetical protein
VATGELEPASPVASLANRTAASTDYRSTAAMTPPPTSPDAGVDPPTAETVQVVGSSAPESAATPLIRSEPNGPNCVEGETADLIKIYNELPPNTQKWVKWWMSAGAGALDTGTEVIRTEEARNLFRIPYSAASPISQKGFRIPAVPRRQC